MYQTTVTACDSCGMWEIATREQTETALLLQGEFSLRKRLQTWYEHQASAAQRAKLREALHELAAEDFEQDD